MIIALLANILLTLGVMALGYLVVKEIAITLSWLRNKIGKRMEDTNGDQIIVSQTKVMEKMAEALENEIKTNGTSTISKEELDNIFENNGVTMATINHKNEIDAESIEMFTTNDMDEKTKQLFRSKGDMIRFTTSK